MSLLPIISERSKNSISKIFSLVRKRPYCTTHMISTAAQNVALLPVSWFYPDMPSQYKREVRSSGTSEYVALIVNLRTLTHTFSNKTLLKRGIQFSGPLFFFLNLEQHFQTSSFHEKWYNKANVTSKLSCLTINPNVKYWIQMTCWCVWC